MSIAKKQDLPTKTGKLKAIRPSFWLVVKAPGIRHKLNETSLVNLQQQIDHGDESRLFECLAQFLCVLNVETAANDASYYIAS